MISSELSALPNNPEILKKIIADQLLKNREYESKLDSFQSEIKTYQQRIEIYEESIAYLKNKIWGPKTEKLREKDERQLCLFDEAEVLQEIPQSAEEITVPAHQRKKSGRKPIPQHFPRVDVVHDLPDSEKQCCGKEMVRIGEEVSEKLDIIPAKIQVLRNIRYKYACKVCEGVESENGTVKIAPAPAQLIEKGILSARFIAWIITAKFSDALPFYRQENIFVRMELELSRATMANTTIKTAERCRPLIELMSKALLFGPMIGIDETPVQVMNEEGRANTTKSYMWIFRGGTKARPIVLFQYRETRSGKFLKEMLADYQGYVQTDGFCGYDGLEEMPNLKGMTLGCWAHGRRFFVEVTKAGQGNEKKVKGRGNAWAIIVLIKKLYAIEAQAREEKMTVEEIYKIRQEQAKPILAEIKKKLDELQLAVPPQSLLGKAIGYAIPRWQQLIRYLDDGNLTIDNNLVENAIRPFAIGRKNWLFSGHPKGAEASANLYSLIETAKANNLEPNAYLHYLFEKIPLIKNEDEYLELLPHTIDPEKLKNFSQV